ncbi:MAG: TolC family protein [Roseateles sp.]|uniref:TolC family protein n=1 Tax=Roseateles sp. TaxID=1971397 RepID=UPI0039E90D95
MTLRLAARPLLAALHAAVLLALAGPAAAQPAAPGRSLPDRIDRLLQEHRLMRVVAADVASADAAIGAEQSAYYPRVSLSMTAGRQKIDRDIGTTGSFNPREQSVSVNQLISDFGATGDRVRTARLVADKERREQELQRQNLLLAAVEAQLALIRASQVVKFARRSEDYVQRQTQLENTRLEAGRGYATDVLQAKAQLAGVQARRIAAERQWQEAVNRYEAVFGERPATAEDLEALAAPAALLPASEEAVLDEHWLGGNPDLIAAQARAQVAHAERDQQRSRELAPRVDLQVSRSRYDELDGVLGRRDDTRAQVRLSWSFDVGMRAARVTDAADQAAISADEKAGYVRIQAMEELRNAWTGWRTARERSAYLNDQVALSGKFLDLGRRERELGRRTLLDLLSGETGLLNAQSDAIAARIDEVVAAYRVMRAGGKLTPALFREPGIVVPGSDLTGDAPAAAAH